MPRDQLSTNWISSEASVLASTSYQKLPYFVKSFSGILREHEILGTRTIEFGTLSFYQNELYRNHLHFSTIKMLFMDYANFFRIIGSF